METKPTMSKAMFIQVMTANGKSEDEVNRAVRLIESLHQNDPNIGQEDPVNYAAFFEGIEVFSTEA